MSGDVERATVIVIGSGQAGLSAGYHLQRRGFVSALTPRTSDGRDERTFVMFDADTAPGGAWQHRWESLRMSTVNGIFDLPGMPVPPVALEESSRTAVPRYFATYEQTMALPILRPVRVRHVTRGDGRPDGDLLVETDEGTWTTRVIINATGTWNAPVLPAIPGRDAFQGRQLHSRDYVAKEEFAGQRVAIVGGGISAVQLLEEISRVATTFWYTRREPVFSDHGFIPEEDGREVIARVTARAQAGYPVGSVVSSTGLGWSPYALEAKRRGVLERRPMFQRLLPKGVQEWDGSTTSVDTVLWATGFIPALKHLEQLHLRGALGGIPMDGTQVAAEPRVHLIGYGPSQSTVGANRAGRAAVDRILRSALLSPWK